MLYALVEYASPLGFLNRAEANQLRLWCTVLLRDAGRYRYGPQDCGFADSFSRFTCVVCPDLFHSLIWFT